MNASISSLGSTRATCYGLVTTFLARRKTKLNGTLDPISSRYGRLNKQVYGRFALHLFSFDVEHRAEYAALHVRHCAGFHHPPTYSSYRMRMVQSSSMTRSVKMAHSLLLTHPYMQQVQRWEFRLTAACLRASGIL